METIKGLANTASSYVYGTDNTTAQSGTEPLSGQSGAGTVSEPYDKGNTFDGTTSTLGESKFDHSSNTTGPHSTNAANRLDPSVGDGIGSDSTTRDHTHGSNHGSSTTGVTSGLDGSDKPSIGHSNTSGTHSHSTTANNSDSIAPSSGSTGPSTNASSGLNPSAAQSTPRPEHETDKTGVTGIHSNDPHGSDIKPTERSDAVGDPESAQKSTVKQQGADRPNEEPTASAIDETKREKDAGEEALKHRDPNDHSGEPMQMHEDKPKAETDRKQSVGQEGGGEHGKVKGTGEEWVKTSGLAAEGGDFDATKPGAGREANRILEEKGIHKDKGDTLGEHSDAFKDSGNATTDASGEKKSLGTKLKEKMHIGSKKE